MKSNKEIEKIFRELREDVDEHISVRIKLLVGLQPIYNKNEGKIEIKLADKLYFGMPEHQLDCYYRGYSLSSEDRMMLLFASKMGYDFSLTAGQIKDFEIEY